MASNPGFPFTGSDIHFHSEIIDLTKNKNNGKEVSRFQEEHGKLIISQGGQNRETDACLWGGGTVLEDSVGPFKEGNWGSRVPAPISFIGSDARWFSGKPGLGFQENNFG